MEGIGAEGPSAMVGRARGTDGAGAGGSSVCLALGDRSPSGLSAVGSSSACPGGGRRKARGLACHLSIVRVASQPRRCSNQGTAGNPKCSSTWHRSRGNKRGMDLVRGKLWRWTLSSTWNKDVIISSTRLN